MKKKNHLNLFKRGMAFLMAVVFTMTTALPVSAASAADAAVSETKPLILQEEPAAEEPTALEEETPMPEQETAEEAEGEEPSGAAEPETETMSEEAGNAPEEESGPADVTIMYYMVGSDLERRDLQATKDLVEIMTGMKEAEDELAEAGIDEDGRVKVNVIVETGGVSFEDSPEEKNKRTTYENELEALENSYSQSEKEIYQKIKEAGIKWDEIQTWELSGSSIKKSAHDYGYFNPIRIMSSSKMDGNSYDPIGEARELEDFIMSTAGAYPAKNYMLVLWDHGAGPEGGYAWDENARPDIDGYITSDLLSRALSNAAQGIRETARRDRWDADSQQIIEGWVSEDDPLFINKSFEKFAFIGFDACLMGNLETAMAVSPYADYLFASEDLQSGTGWDHRGYVKELLMLDPDEYEKERIQETTRMIGCKMANDMMAWYEHTEDTSTISVVSLNKAQLSELDTALGSLAEQIQIHMLAGEEGIFNATDYPKFLKALQESIHFNGKNSGIVDLYSLCSEVSMIDNVPEPIVVSANKVMSILKPDGFNYANNEDSNPGPVIYESYTLEYPFASDEKNKNSLGGLTVFFPHDAFRFVKDGKVERDSFENYLNIYYNGEGAKQYLGSGRLGNGYKSLLETFCSIQVVGSTMADGFDKEDEEVLEAMKKTVSDVKADYSLSPDSVALKTITDMAKPDGPVTQRISADDLSMKTIIRNGAISYAYDANGDKYSMINKITHEMMFTDESNAVHRLGFLPDVTEEDLGDILKRFIPQNRDKGEWFFIGDIPASIYSIENIGEGDLNMYNALDPNSEVLVRISMAMRKPTSAAGEGEADEIVILEAKVGMDSKNVVPRGYYKLNISQKQLYGFVPWSDVPEETIFRPLSDLGEYITGEESGFKEDDRFATCYGDALKKSRVIINRGEGCTVASTDKSRTNVKMNYLLYDIFGGAYLIDSLEQGVDVTAVFTILQNGEKDNTYFMEEGSEVVFPVIRYNTGEYSLSLNKDLPIGYWEGESFHELKDAAAFKNLKPGVYNITFRDHDSKTNTIALLEGTEVSVDGVEAPVDASRYYRFVPDELSYELTVGNSKSGLTIEKISDLPYGFYKTLNMAEGDLANFVSVKNGNGDMMKSTRTYLTVSVNGAGFNLNSTGEKGIDGFKALDLEPGSKITVSAGFRIGNGADKTSIYSPEAAELTIMRQPVKLYGQPVDKGNPVESFLVSEFDHNNSFWDSGFKEDEIPLVKIRMYLNDKVYEDRNDSRYIGSAQRIDKLLSTSTVSAVAIDVSDVNGIGIYENLNIGPKAEGEKRPAAWEDKHFSTEFAKYYIVEAPEDAVLEKYEVYTAAEVSFRSLKATNEDVELYKTMYVPCVSGNETYQKSGRWPVSAEAITMKGDGVKQWYVRIGDQKRVPVWLDGKAWLYYDNVDGAERQLVAQANNGAWEFYLPHEAASNTVCFYAGYEENVTTLNETGKTKFNVTVDTITPVEYTGKNLVTTDSGKTGSKTIGLTLRDASGKVLKEGTDYKVSYKNNRNTAGPSAVKAPTMIITGKGSDYMGLKAEVKFTILPADLCYALVTSNKKFAPFTSSGKLNTTVTVKLPSGTKVPAVNYDILYYDEDGNEITKDQMKKFYAGDEAVYVKICVRGKLNTKKNAVNNYMAGSQPTSIYVTGYPKGAKKPVVKLNNSKQTFKAGKPVKTAELAKNILKSVKVGKATLDPADLKEVRAYYDSNLTQPAAENGMLMDRAGIYYLAFELKDEKKGRTAPNYPAYYAASVKYTLTGSMIIKGKTKMENNTIEYAGGGNNVSVSIQFDLQKMHAEELYMTYTTRDGSTGGGTVGYRKNAINGFAYDFYIDDNGKLTTDAIDNGARGSYKITLEGRDAYAGHFTLSYKVK